MLGPVARLIRWGRTGSLMTCACGPRLSPVEMSEHWNTKPSVHVPCTGHAPRLQEPQLNELERTLTANTPIAFLLSATHRSSTATPGRSCNLSPPPRPWQLRPRHAACLFDGRGPPRIRWCVAGEPFVCLDLTEIISAGQEPGASRRRSPSLPGRPARNAKFNNSSCGTA